MGSRLPLTQSTRPSKTASGYASTVTLAGVPDMHTPDVDLVDVSEHPDAVELAYREKLLSRPSATVLALNLHAGGDVAKKDLAVDGRGERISLRHGVDIAHAQQELLLRLCPFQLGFRISIAVLRSFDVGLRTGLRLEELFLAPEVVIGRNEIGFRLVCVAHGAAVDVR